MAAMKYKARKTGWVVHPVAQPVFRGVYPRCSCGRRLTDTNRSDSRTSCNTCFPNRNTKEG